MYPILYPANATVFTNQGLGAMSDALSAQVTEERNGAFEFEMSYPVKGLHLDELHEGMLIKAKPNDTSEPQLFVIYDIEKEFGGRVKVLAEHISYKLNDYPVLPTESKLENKSPCVIWNFFAHGGNGSNQDPSYTPPIEVSDFTFETDGDFAPFDIEVYDVITIRSLLGGREGSILDETDGEYEFDNFKIILHKSRGTDNGVSIKYGKDLTDLTQEISIEGLYTHIFPYAKKTTYPEPEEGSEASPDPIEEWIYYIPSQETSDDHGIWSVRGVLALTEDGVSLESKYGFRKVKLLDLTDAFDPDFDFSGSDVKDACNSYISSNSTIKKPKITLQVSFEPKKVKSGDKYSESLEKIGLCDTVRVELPLYGIDEKLKVNKTVYDVLNERYKSIDIGDAQSNFADTLREQFDS